MRYREFCAFLAINMFAAGAVLAADGVWRVTSESGYQRLLVADEGDYIVFNYVSESPGSRCAVPGYATKVSSKPFESTYVFRDDPEHRRWGGKYEGYSSYAVGKGLCVIRFSFAKGEVAVVEESGNCNGFCGVHGGIGGVLKKVPIN